VNLELDGKIALVAGAGRGTGRAVALALAREGADVALLARTAAELEAAAADVRALGRRALPVAVDLADDAAREAAVARARAELGPPTLLVLAAAALFRPTKLHNLALADVDELLSIDLRAAVALCRALLPDMLAARHGRVVALGSLAARGGVPGGALYATAKAGLEGLCRGLSLDYARYGITANTVALGFVDSERLAARTDGDPAARERLVRATAARRIPTPAEVADVVAFLCSARAAAITGAVIDVTAGAHLNNLW